MKKLIRLGLCLGVLTAALTCSALAATEGYTTDSAGTVNYAGGKYTASYTGATSGNQYVILVVKGSASDYSISENTIMYIDQKAAESGTISFDFIPKSTPDCVVLLGGEFSDGQSPKVLGTLIGQGTEIEVPKANISYVGMTAPIMKLTDESGQDFVFAVQSDGNFVVGGVTDGTYTFSAQKKSHLTYTRELVVENGAVVGSIPEIRMLAGDTNSDGLINATDLGAILRDYAKSGAADSAANINEDAFVNATDLSAVLANYLKQYER